LLTFILNCISSISKHRRILVISITIFGNITGDRRILVISITIFGNITGEANAESADSKSTAVDISGSQHVLVCALHELGCLVLSLGTSASPLVAEPATGNITDSGKTISII